MSFSYPISQKTAAIATQQIKTLSTYFLFPFALDKLAIQADHPQAWAREKRWIDGVDAWIAGESGRCASQGIARLGPWRRASYNKFDCSSSAYSDLLGFHAIVRHVFFDTTIGRHPDSQENQLRCYTIEIPKQARVFLEGQDSLGRGGRSEIIDLRLYVSTHGIGILSMGVMAGPISADEALWINRRLRKLYALDEKSLRDGGTPSRVALILESTGNSEVLCEERFARHEMVGFYPPLSNVVKSLLYFADYQLEEYEPVLDENLVVYSYCELDADLSGSDHAKKELEFTIDALLHLNHKHDVPAEHIVYGAKILFGFTAHNWSIVKLGNDSEPGGNEHQFAVQRSGESQRVDDAFHRRYYLMMVVALLYRAVLLEFSERGALVSRLLLEDQQAGRLTLPTVTMVNDLRLTFLNFCSYWHYDDLSSNEDDNSFFRRLCGEYTVPEMKRVLADEFRHMGDFVYNFYQLRATDAVNRLAMLSLIFGGGAVLTGFFGMNFGREFGQVLFEGEGGSAFIHYFLVAVVCLFVFGSLSLGTFVLLRNWREYLAILNPQRNPRATSSIKRGS